jgi:hypothetical protein
MDLTPEFRFQPTTPLTPTTPAPPSPGPPLPPPPPSQTTEPPDLGALNGLLGTWNGKGFNTIWRPFNPQSVSDHFLMINVTEETIQFDVLPGAIPNRGLLQGDLKMSGIRYLQQISDANVVVGGQNAGLHVEPGLWLSVPATTDPELPATVARLASIPHGTTIVAQGTMTTTPGPPVIPTVSITPFPINGGAPVPFPEQTLSNPSQFRTGTPGDDGVIQSMLDNPNSVLTEAAIAGVSATTTLLVSTTATPVLGGGTANTAFLQGGPDGPNADAAQVEATFWLQTTPGSPVPDLLQYTQRVLLNFAGLSWPHVTVATLKKES